MNVEAKKLELVQMILKTDKPSVLEKISKILTKDSDVDFWDELPTRVKDSINRGIEQAQEQNTTPHSDVMKKHKKWL